MNYIFLILGILGQLFMMITYTLNAMDKNTTMKARIQYILFASVCCIMVVVLIIGLMKFSYLQDKK